MLLDKSETLYSIHILFAYRILLFLTELLHTSESWKEMYVSTALSTPLALLSQSKPLSKAKWKTRQLQLLRWSSDDLDDVSKGETQKV